MTVSTLPFDTDVVAAPLRRDLDALRQGLATRLLTVKGSWYLDPEIGVSYSLIYRNSRQPQAAVVPIRREVLTYRDVLAITKAELDIDDRARTLRYDCPLYTSPSPRD